MAGESNGYRAALMRRQLVPELISSLSGKAGPPFISFSTGYPEMDSTVAALHTREHREDARDWLDGWALVTFGPFDPSKTLIEALSDVDEWQCWVAANSTLATAARSEEQGLI
jgi:hypothetical protein